jgi:hypothetical protein
MKKPNQLLMVEDAADAAATVHSAHPVASIRKKTKISRKTKKINLRLQANGYVYFQNSIYHK